MKVPGSKARAKARGDNKVVRDKFYSTMRLPTAPRSGSGFSLARTGGIPNMDPRRDAFLQEGAIDPANIRHRQDPINSLPYDFQTGNLGFKYQLAPDQMTATSSIPLMQKARQSFYNRVNLLQPMGLPVRDVTSQPA
jgi:hypothetical protein